MNIFIDLHENVTTLNKFSMFFLFLHEQIFNTTNVKGKYVNFLDSDDYFSSNVLETVENSFCLENIRSLILRQLRLP